MTVCYNVAGNLSHSAAYMHHLFIKICV